MQSTTSGSCGNKTICGDIIIHSNQKLIKHFSKKRVLYIQLVQWSGLALSMHRPSNLQYTKSAQDFQYFSYDISVLQYNFAYLCSQYFSVYLQYFASKIRISTDESVWLEALQASPESQSTHDQEWTSLSTN